MAYVEVDKLLKNTPNSIYKLVILAARRAKEIGSGSEKLVDVAVNAKPASVAFKEIMENKISFKEKKK